jgi:hypothetical protein
MQLPPSGMFETCIMSNSLETSSDRMGSAVSYWIELHKNATTLN